MKEIKFNAYLRSYGVRVTGDDLHIVRSLYDQLHDPTGFDQVECEVIVRVHDRRQDWIDKHYKAAMRSVEAIGSCTLKFCKDATIMVERGPFPNITTSAPRHGDKYDRKVGIAVCYAKMRGETVPEYI